MDDLGINRPKRQNWIMSEDSEPGVFQSTVFWGALAFCGATCVFILADAFMALSGKSTIL